LERANGGPDCAISSAGDGVRDDDWGQDLRSPCDQVPKYIFIQHSCAICPQYVSSPWSLMRSSAQELIGSMNGRYPTAT
jgi:hypothetical protein